MPNTFSVRRSMLPAMLVASCLASPPAVATGAEPVILPLDGVVPAEPLAVHGAVKVAELQSLKFIPQLKSAFRTYSITTGGNERLLLLTNRRSRMGNGTGYCGAGHELELHLASATGRAKILDSYALEGCVSGNEVTREPGLTVMHDVIEFRRFCDPSDVVVRLAWGNGKFKRSFAWSISDPTQQLSDLVQRSDLQPRRTDILDMRTTDGSELGVLLAGATEVRTLRRWQTTNQDVVAVEVTTTPVDGRGNERHLLVIGEGADGYAQLRQFIEVARFGEDAHVTAREGPVGGRTLFLPLKCGNEMVPLTLQGGLLKMQ